jgi:hypothetical protein
MPHSMSDTATCPVCGATVPVEGYEEAETLHNVRPLERRSCPNGHDLRWEPDEQAWKEAEDT